MYLMKIQVLHYRICYNMLTVIHSMDAVNRIFRINHAHNYVSTTLRIQAQYTRLVPDRWS